MPLITVLLGPIKKLKLQGKVEIDRLFPFLIDKSMLDRAKLNQHQVKYW